MSITLKDLYSESKDKYNLKLLTDTSTLDNVVSWFHFMEDESTIDFIRGNEIIVTTGLGSKNEKWLDDLIKGLIEKHASGLIVNIGQYILTIPEHTIQLCNENNFPLFTIPWKIHLVDIMQDYCNRIIKAEHSKSNVCAAFFNAIFSPSQKDSYVPCLKQTGYNLNGSFMILSIGLNKLLFKKTNEIKLKNFIMRLENKLNSQSIKYSILVENTEFNIILNFIDNSTSQHHMQNLLADDLINYSEIKCIGISSLVTSIENLSKAYTEACHSKLECIKENKTIIYYDDMGIDKLLLNINNTDILKNLYNKYLGPLNEYDMLHNTDYENILKIYLKNNCSIQAVSKKTYTHRNTINYRIKKIKEIINSQLDDSEEIFNFLLAFHIKDILSVSFNK